jgi:hypothetical protein
MADFDKLTVSQRRVLGCIAIGQDGMHHPRVLAKLESLGLIYSYDETLPPTKSCRLPMTIKRWDIASIAIHMEWCEWCSKHVTQEAAHG